jgi:hypothetical protein
MIDSGLKQLLKVILWTALISFTTGLATMASIIYWP